MRCSKCNHILPDDSKFCQYCGRRIDNETDKPAKINTEVDAVALPGLENLAPDDAVSVILKLQAKQTIKAMEANGQSQPNRESDADFGLIPEKPIYTHALKSVDGEREYLNKLCAVNGEKITWNRRGSTSAAGINGMIDIYDTYLPSGQPYKTIYINMYGAKTSTAAPKGFTMCGINGSSSKLKTLAANNKDTTQGKSFSFVTTLSIAFCILSILLVIIAMNLQDVDRNFYEQNNPTTLYFVLIGIYLVSVAVPLSLGRKGNFAVQHAVAFIPAVFAVGALLEGSLFSDSYLFDGQRQFYIHYEQVNLLNTLWVLLAFALLLINIAPMISKLQSKWYASFRHWERSYNRVYNMKKCMDEGIITEEEFERIKQKLLKNIKS